MSVPQEVYSTDPIEDAEIKADLAKLDLIVEKARLFYDDERLTIIDVYQISQVAEWFSVPKRAAYLRSKQMGLLSYQSSGAPS